MAKSSTPSADDLAAADVAKVDRPAYEETAAAQAAETVEPPAPADAEQVAEDLAADKGSPEVPADAEIKLNPDFDFEGDQLRIAAVDSEGNEVVQVLSREDSKTVKETQALALEQHPAVIRVESAD